ncbi:MAG: M48 family metalloprotease [Gallionella sp.]
MKILLKRYGLLIVVLSLMTGCAQNPVTGGADFVMMSENQELAEGHAADVEVRKQYLVYADEALQQYVNRVGQKLAMHSHRPNLSYHFTVLDSTEINAFALPGGYVYITRGILAYLNSEAELAAVLGHEIGHVTARHGVRQQSAAQAANIGLTIASIFVPQLRNQNGQNLGNVLNGALLSGYGREHELQADALGAGYLAASGYDPQAIIQVIGVLKNQETQDAILAKQEGREARRYHGVFATHPDNDTRLKQAVAAAGTQSVAQAIIGHDEFLHALEGLTFKEASEQGVLRNNTFYQADMNIAVAFPAAWQVHNLADALFAVSDAAEAKINFKFDDKPVGSVLAYAQRLGGAEAQIEQLTSHDLDAVLYRLPARSGALVYVGTRAYVIEAEAKTPELLAKYQAEIRATLLSFHVLSKAELPLAQALKLHVIAAPAGATFAALAQQSPLGKSAESYLRLLNGRYPAGEPQAGQLIKVVQ